MFYEVSVAAIDLHHVCDGELDTILLLACDLG